MAVNNPPIKKSQVESSWDLEVTAAVNTLEGRLQALLQAIKNTTDLETLKEDIKNI